jgi:hypothetical protein
MAVAILTLRRGTTTPSLAQSELFFNTSTNTLNVGGTSGTITLVKLGSNTGNITLTGNLSIDGGISGSTLDITGNAKIDGNVLIGGNIVLGTGSNDIITVNAPFTGSLIPQEDGIDSLGSPSKRFKSLHVVSASIDSILLPGSGILSSSTDNFTNFSQSVDSRLDNLQLDSQSQDSRLDSLESFTASQASNNDDIIELFATASIHEVRIDNLSSLTGSYATTGSNVFRGNQTISGSVNISGSTTILGSVNANLFMNPQTLTADIVVPDNTNALLLGPVNVGGSISLGLSSSLLVLPEDFTSFASTGSNQFRGNQYITGSIIPQGSGSHDLGSLTNPFRDLYLSSASLRIVNDGEILSEISANSQRLLVSASETYFAGNVNVSGSVRAQLFIGSFSGSLSVQDDRLSNLESFTSSQESKNTTLGTYTSSVDSRLSQLETNTGSIQSDLSELFSTASNHEDRIDGIESYTSSLKQAIDVNGGNLVVYGDLTVQGTTTTLNTTELLIEDKVLSIASGSTTSIQADGAGLYISGADASILWNNSQNSLVINQKVSSSVGFKGDGSELTGLTADSVDFNNVTNKPPLVSGSSQVTSSLDFRYLEINGDNVVSGSSQVEITNTSGFSTFSGSLKTTNDGQDSRLSNLELTSQSHDGRISQLESNSGSDSSRISNLEAFTSSQQSINSLYNSYTQSNDGNINNLFNSSSQYQIFSESIDDIVKDKINLDGLVSSSSNTSTISLSIQSGVISGNVIGGIVSGSDQVTSSLDSLYEVSGSVAQLVGIYEVSGSLGSAAWYNVSSSISDGNPQVLGNAGAVKNYIDQQLLIVGAGDITAVVAGAGISGGASSGPATLSLDTSSAHFTNGVLSSITSFSSSVDTRLDSLELFSSSLEGGFVTQTELATATGSLINSIVTKLDTGSFNTISASFDTRLDSLESDTGSQDTRLDNLEGFTSSIDTIIKTKLNTETVISGSSQVIGILSSLNLYTSSNDTSNTAQNSRLDQLSTASGSAITRLNLLEVETANLEAFTSSIDTTIKNKLNADGVLSGSTQVLGGSGLLSSSVTNFTNFSQSVDSRLDNLEGPFSISVDNRLDQLESLTASLSGIYEQKASGTHTLVSGSSQLTSSYDNRYVTLNGDQTIGSTKTFNNINVNGTASFAYIQSTTGSSTSIGESFIILNESTPSSNFAGIKVVDSGSTFATASFVYDGLNNNWVFEKAGGTETGSSLTIFGPVSNNGLGTEVGLTENRVPKAVTNHGHHIGDSNITDSGTLITLNSNSQVNGNLVVNGSISANNLVSGSSQINLGGDLTGTANNAQIASGVIVNDDVNASAGIVHTKLNLGGSGIISGSSQISYPGLSNIPAGIVSGSSQIDLTATTNYVSGIKTRLNAEGVISGSSQITRTLQQITDTGASTSNAITITNSTASTSRTTGAIIVTGGIGTSGDIFAGGDVVAYASSDIRLKTNLELIPNSLQKINQIGGYSFEWNIDKQNIYKGKDYGVIAQEIEQILPELVDTRENGYKAVKYDKLVSLLIEGIKDLSKQVEELKEKINQG